MPAGLKYTIYAVIGGVWASGCVWLLLQQYFATTDEFGVRRHPWQPAILSLHGVLSIAASFVLGWVVAKHGSEAWHQRRRRISGGGLTLVLAILSISGFLLFFVTDDTWQFDSARIHEWLGLAATLFGVEHWRVMNGRAGSD